MTLRKSLSAYYEELDRAFHLYRMEALRHYGPETAHSLRVNLKRQNAFFHLLQALEVRFRAGLALDAFDAIYRRAGRVRNRQVERQLIEKKERKLNQAHRLSAWLEAKENRRAKQLRKYGAKHSITPVRELSSRVYSVLQHIDEAAAAPRMLAYFRKLIHAIADFSDRPNAPAEHLHDLRKFIKELFYNIEFLQRHFGPETLQIPALTNLDEIQHLLGKWHDHDFTLLHLTSKKASHDAAFFAALEREKRKWEKQARGMFGKLREDMRELEERLEGVLGMA